MHHQSVPDGYRLLDRKSAFSDLTGPYYMKAKKGPIVKLGLRIEAQHLNKVGVAHGGALMTLADNAIGDAVIQAYDHPVSAVTVTMNTEFMNPAVLGDWVEAEAQILKKGGRLLFASCIVSVQDKRIMHASGVMALVKTPV